MPHHTQLKVVLSYVSLKAQGVKHLKYLLPIRKIAFENGLFSS